MSERDRFYTNNELWETRLTDYQLGRLRRRVPSEADSAEITVVDLDGTSTHVRIPFTPREAAEIDKGQQALDRVLAFLTPTPDGDPLTLTLGLKRFPNGRGLLHRVYSIGEMIHSGSVATDILSALQMFPQTEQVRREVMPQLKTLLGVPRAVFQAGQPGGRR